MGIILKVYSDIVCINLWHICANVPTDINPCRSYVENHGSVNFINFNQCQIILAYFFSAYDQKMVRKSHCHTHIQTSLKHPSDNKFNSFYKKVYDKAGLVILRFMILLKS